MSYTVVENGVVVSAVRGSLTSLRLQLAYWYNVEPVTNTRRRPERTTDDRRRGVHDARLRPSRLYFSHFATRTVDNDNTVCSEARYSFRLQNRVFLPTPPALTPPLRGLIPSEYRHPVWHGKTRMAWLPDSEKISKISLFVLAQFTNVADGQTDNACRHRPRFIYASHRATKTARICNAPHHLKFYMTSYVFHNDRL